MKASEVYVGQKVGFYYENAVQIGEVISEPEESPTGSIFVDVETDEFIATISIHRLLGVVKDVAQSV